MAGVDDKIVSMKFDNATFEQKLSETVKSIDKLNQTIANAGAVNGLKDVGAAANNVDMGPLQRGVEGVSLKFAALATVAITALSNITNRAVDAGIRIAKSLTLDPVLEGFREYETNMNSIQTILANTKSKGSTLTDVNKALDELNTYADQTIYNFSEMTRNIGTFTAAGVDLDTSASAIKGIANVAAISGSNSQQASTAMYQLSQALATGSLKLMDWNSVVNAGMGGEVMQKALFDTGKAMGTIADVPMDMSFEKWKDSGNSFRNSLQEGWVTADVLTTTLGAFSGELDVAALKAAGFSDVTAAEMVELGKLGVAAATEVKTFTQLIDTVKEAIGSGWSSSFKIVVGDFEEAKALFTEISEGIGDMVGASAEARNEMLQGWKDLGGRDLLIQGFRDAIEGLGSIIAPIKDAFREIFPKKTAEDLMSITEAFANFTEKIKIGGETASKIKSVFSGVFSVFSIGWEVIKGVASVIGDLIGAVAGASGGVLTFAANAGDMVTNLQEVLVEGGAIRDFFDKIGEAVKDAVGFIKDFSGGLAGMFSGFAGTEVVEAGVSAVTYSMGRMGGAIDSAAEAWDWFTDRLEGVTGALKTLGGHLSTWIGELKDKMVNIFQPGDFDAAVDVVNVGLLGGIVAMLKKFLDGGIFDMFGGGGIIESISESFDALTGSLQAMQADIKAKVIQKIAIAIGILTASLVVLASINSADLAKALGAITVGMGQLMGAMALLNKLDLGTSAAKLTVLSAAMIGIATAMTILSVAIKNLSGLGWEELAKGLVGVGAGLGIMVTGMNLLTTNTSGLIKAGIAMTAMSVGLLAMSAAVKSFSDMSWGEMAQGMVGVGVGLGLLAGAMKLMPTSGMVQAGIGLVAISGGLLILSEAVQSFAGISWGEMAKGFTGIGAGLVIIAGAMHLMPANMIGTATALLVLSGALNVMAAAVAAIGDIPFGELVKGIGGLAAMLAVLSVAMIAMTGTAAGAGALLVVSGALVVLTGVIKTLGKTDIKELAVGLGAIAAVLVVLGVGGLALTPVVPVLFALGSALMLIGGAFALFGVGAMAMAKAFELIAEAGKAGLGVLLEMIEMVIGALPGFVGALVQAFAELILELANAAGLIVEALTVLIGHILEAVKELAPQFIETVSAIITSVLEAIKINFPLFVETGMAMLVSLLTGIRDNIFQLATMGVEIITQLAAAIVANMATIVNTAVNVITSFLGALAERAADLVAAGLGLLTSLIQGITANLSMVTNAVKELILTLITEVVASTDTIIDHGFKALTWLLSGILDNLVKVTEAVATMITRFIGALGENTKRIIDAGFKVLTDLLQGIGDNLRKVVETVATVVTEFVTAVGNKAQEFITAGADALVDFLDGIGNNIQKVLDKGVEVAGEFVQGVADAAVTLANAGLEALVDFLEGLEGAIRANSGRIRSAGLGVADAIVDGIVGGLSASKAVNAVINKAKDLAGSALSAVGDFLGISSPSKEFFKIGEFMVQGMAEGLDDPRPATRSAVALADNVREAFEEIISHIPDVFDGMDEFNPTVTPVLDLSQVQADARGMNGLMAARAIVPEVSFARARTIATTDDLTGKGTETPTQTIPQEVKFEQNIYSPTALSTNDIYKNTKSQIAMAKEELNI